ncbi:hypothetical protein Q4493_15825 [Colwellia sp. 1_MG-2023]|uniref:hypothetical protein n=1 Tax=Colwellia sp. 1_MG-2023 TaxID=3062649 RepID=UPI0026E19587|nr:hypothetical protein [Colwellia sp. 1_MG-2023]MDO6447238.1 hypothetical protein [Colwellia sp. 1_MG-2023]
MEERSVLQVGGSLEKAVKGEYSIDVKAILAEAWSTTSKSRIAINVGLLFTLSIGVIITLIISNYLGGIEEVFQNQQSSALLNIIVTLVVYPFLVGVEMMGVFHAVGLNTHPKLVFAFLKRGSWVAICALLTSTLITMGITFFVLPGIYLAVALSLVLPLVVEKRFSPLKAITLSLQATRFQWFNLFALYLILFFLLIVASLPLLLLGDSSVGLLGGVITMFALTYVAPLFYNVKGILYREIFGMQLSIAKGSGNDIDTTFTA